MGRSSRYDPRNGWRAHKQKRRGRVGLSTVFPALFLALAVWLALGAPGCGRW
jgi:hypothetical protein